MADLQRRLRSEKEGVTWDRSRTLLTHSWDWDWSGGSVGPVIAHALVVCNASVEGVISCV